MQNKIEKIIKECRKYTKQGEVASYIPELKKANKDALGIYIDKLDGNEFYAGDYETKFTIQSISKVISLIIAIMDNGMEKVLSKVGVEPSAYSFNSIVTLEVKNANKPLNPMINAGAIATVSLIKGDSPEEVIGKILDFTKKITGNEDIKVNEAVYQSEKRTGDRNRSLAYFMKGTGVIEKDVEKVLDAYFQQCSIEVTCKDIAKIGSFLANDGVLPSTGERIVPKEVTRVVKAVMATCGMYDASGSFAVKVGIPSKSGVGGGIMATVPGKMGIGVVGPSLDEKGNSIAGIKVLEQLSEELDLSIF
ncbi:glutaminase A [Clostridium cochlearium]|jgi:glutaminase|uniref:glutaminase A n=1 Tax=Clostridium cochlearium TaxID=1494 RepID=UPI000B947805|nr:glutaminase A [Clostridium cochlearium]MBV1820446.1 glutaminase A [Bacteroidales bacterium MSK.15.36]NSJ91464.1 glutaminase A [Coprococcus sp. MSK.21.13]MBU5270340.1 glutaminase A [Clostridium cochlearium]MCG4572162.1 glutaminase A [Clostridium cochlearium]MCG4579690.1 glutaminase A [Clostridium cochlearium]